MTTKILSITTEGDCEGKPVKQLGNFLGTPNQAIAYLAANEITPCYKYRIREIEIEDVSGLHTGSYNVVVDTGGFVNRFEGKLPEALKQQAKINKLFKGLSDEDKELLESHYKDKYCGY